MSDFESGAFNRALPTLLLCKFTRNDSLSKEMGLKALDCLMVVFAAKP